MNLPEHDEVVAFLMAIYDWTFHLVFIIAIGTLAYVIWHLIPRKEY